MISAVRQPFRSCQGLFSEVLMPTICRYEQEVQPMAQLIRILCELERYRMNRNRITVQSAANVQRDPAVYDGKLVFMCKSKQR